MSERVDDEGNRETAVAGGEDHIGTLPDELLQYMMSFLLSRDAVRTCVLAKRWRTLWKSVPALRLHDTQSYEAITGSSTFLHELIRLRDPTPLDEFEISSFFPENVDHLLDMADAAFRHMFPWLRYALWCQVKVLTLHFPLLLTHVTIMSPHLKKLCLYNVWLEGCSLDFSNCEVLEVLEFQQCTIYGDILSQSLRHLSIKDGCAGPSTRTRISTPNLLYLKLVDFWDFIPFLDSMPSLVKASVKLGLLCQDACDCGSQSCTACCGSSNCSVVLQGLSDARELKLTTTYDDVNVFRKDLKWCPMFGKLKTLLLNEWCVVDNFIGLVCFLQHTPILETLTLRLTLNTNTEDVMETAEGNISSEQSLLSKHLKVVKIVCDKKKDVRVQHMLKILSTHGVPPEKIDIQ